MNPAWKTAVFVGLPLLAALWIADYLGVHGIFFRMSLNDLFAVFSVIAGLTFFAWFWLFERRSGGEAIAAAVAAYVLWALPAIITIVVAHKTHGGMF